MYAIIETGGKQYRVSPGDIVHVERLAGSEGDTVTLDEVLLVGGEGETRVGAPRVPDASVRGTVVEQDGVFFAASALDQAARRLANELSRKPDGMTVAEVRDLLGTSRKFVLPILGWFDRTGMTKRRDDFRIAGPRLPDPD